MDMYQHGRSEYSQSQGKYIYISRKITFSNITVTNDNHGLSDSMHEASYKIHSEIFGLATTAVEWILSVMHSHYSTPLPILLKNKVRSIINKYGDYGQIITKYGWEEKVN